MENQITLDSIKSKIADECYIVLPDGRTTVCMLSMENGYTIKGISACMKASNFNMDVGRLEAYEDAMRQIWQFEGYLLAEKLHNKAEAEKKDSNIFTLSPQRVMALKNAGYWDDPEKRNRMIKRFADEERRKRRLNTFEDLSYWEGLEKLLDAFAPVPKKPPKIKKARYGLKKDGTPRSKPGRKPSK